MALEDQISTARKEIKPDGYDMSVGEIMNLYHSGELIISPAYQRLFRWQPLQKTRFIESLLLGIPIPPIFVFQSGNGTWELIDGLQRVSTILEFSGILGDVQIATDETEDDTTKQYGRKQQSRSLPKQPVTLLGTSFLPALENKAWQSTKDGTFQGIGTAAQLYIRRARIRVEILRQEHDANIKYELFQRLNTGGTKLSEQEVRNCTAIMIDSSFHTWLSGLASNPSFVKTTAQTDDALRKQTGTELALRFIAFRHVPYSHGLDVHEYLDAALLKIAANKNFDRKLEEEVFRRTFEILDRALGSSIFKRWNGKKFSGKFLMSLFEVIAVGASRNLPAFDSMEPVEVDKLVKRAAKALQTDKIFLASSGAGVRGTTRLANLLKLGEPLFRP